MPTGLLRCKRFLRWPKGGKTMERQSDHRMSFGKQVEPCLESSLTKKKLLEIPSLFLEGRPFDDERQPPILNFWFSSAARTYASAGVKSS